MGKKRKRMLARLRQERASIVQVSSTPPPLVVKQEPELTSVQVSRTPPPLVVEQEPELAAVSAPKKKASKRKSTKSRTKKV